MVNLREVKAANNGLKSSAPGLTAVFIGATSGIGRSAVKKFAQDTISPIVYLAGRSKSSAGPLLAELKSLNARGNFIFIEAEVSLIKEVDKVCDEIKSKEQKIDLLFLSSGMLRTGGRQENTTSEGLAIMMALSYYCRMRFISNLLPLLSKSASPRVVTILGAGLETTINTNDLELSSESTYSMINAMNHTGTMTSLALSELAKANPRVSFVHKYPGFVNTGLLDGILAAWTGIWAILGTALRYTILPISGLFQTSVDDAGERALYDATNEKFKSAGSYRLNENDELAKEVPALSQYLEEGMGQKVWENTEGVFEKVLARA